MSTGYVVVCAYCGVDPGAAGFVSPWFAQCMPCAYADKPQSMLARLMVWLWLAAVRP